MNDIWDWLMHRFSANTQTEAIIDENKGYTYGDISDQIMSAYRQLQAFGIKSGQVVCLFGKSDVQLMALLFALVLNKNIIVPISLEKRAELQSLLEIAKAEHLLEFDDDGCMHTLLLTQETHPLLEQVRMQNEPGFLIFTSGSSGAPKCAAHLFSRLAAKYLHKPSGKAYRTLVFLKADHIGGLNTIFSILFTGGTMILINDRSVTAVCQAIQQHRVELLPTTPSFLNMMVISKASEKYDLSSLKLLTYGTEPMLPSTLVAVNNMFQGVRVKQTYGLTELGIFPTQSKTDDSVFIKLGGNGYEMKVVEGFLYIRTPYMMLGYLNAESPFDDDGWYFTGDQVCSDGEYFSIVGRKENIINVGGEKVYPSEIENILIQMANVANVVVAGKSSPVLGQIVAARFQLYEPEDANVFKERLYKYAKDKLESYKIPRLIHIVEDSVLNVNLKKVWL